MFKSLVAVSLTGLILSLTLLLVANLRHGAPIPDSHAQIEDVLPGTPAAAVGLQRGDILLALDGVDVPMNELQMRIGCGCASFHTRRLTFERDGELYTLPIRAEHHRIGVHFGAATRYEPNLFRAAWTAYRAWQLQAYAPSDIAAAIATPNPFGERHLIAIHSTPHRRAAIVSIVLFWGGLLTLFGALALQLRRRKS